MIPCNCDQCSSSGKCDLESERREDSLLAWVHDTKLTDCLLQDEIKDRGGR